MKHLIKIISVIFFLSIFSCNEDKVFEAEMYKKIFSLVSSGAYNILTVEHDLDKPEITGFVSASCGGTTPTDKDILITLREDDELFNLYNRNNFENEADFANLLNPGRYTIDDYTFKIPAGEKSGRMSIKVRPEGLSPDSTYFISFKIDKFTNYEANPDKTNVLYRIMLKNYWALQATSTNYTLKGVYQGANLIGNKRLFPLTYNQVRVNVGNVINFTADTSVINTRSVILEVQKAQGEKVAKGTRYDVIVKPYKRITILPPLTADPDYPNVFFIEDDGFRTYKTFLVHYRYRLVGDDTIYEMKEELRMEFVYKDEI